MLDNVLTTPRLMSPKQAAAYLAISERKLWDMSKRELIPVVHIGRCVRYDVGDLDGFISAAKGGQK
jgi:predicted DNA-binding transcriptional regulator AlpA